MKKLTFILLASIVIAFAACTKEKLVEVIVTKTDTVHVVDIIKDSSVYLKAQVYLQKLYREGDSKFKQTPSFLKNEIVKFMSSPEGADYNFAQIWVGTEYMNYSAEYGNASAFIVFYKKNSPCYVKIYEEYSGDLRSNWHDIKRDNIVFIDTFFKNRLVGCVNRHEIL